MSLGLRHAGICVLHQDSEHRFDFVENPPPSWPHQDMVGLREAEALPASIAADFAAAHERSRRDGAEQMLAFELGEIHRRHFEIRLLPDDNSDGVTAIVTDTTDRHARDMAVASLLREVSHRSKNLLAIVQSVAMQTARHSTGTEDFLDKFRGRLHALSSTQDLVTESNWRGAYLQTLVASQLVRLGPSVLSNVRITGVNPLLGPNASLHIGLAIHELGANTVLHGALANGEPGKVSVDARMVDRPDSPADLVIEWRESGTPAWRLEHQPHFGTLVLERIVPLSVGGTADFGIEPDGVRYRLVVPADQFEA
ncbi:sensor histidine kinase [Devosia ginsengisoli]|uniref:sensor histidine kinase n=1 Tax=Devosia ginsengisoli TaxID=400770 RepID=UPI0026EE6FD2|nr:sensor histidine kinase [Devosia ginsengisoli]MCR6671646.1 sensor histidine kinase [Devosia ginsengisoli]